jgi:hypothetical protein
MAATFVSAASYYGKKLMPRMYIDAQANLERTLLLSTDTAVITPVQGLLSI